MTGLLRDVFQCLSAYGDRANLYLKRKKKIKIFEKKKILQFLVQNSVPHLRCSHIENCMALKNETHRLEYIAVSIEMENFKPRKWCWIFDMRKTETAYK